MARSKAKCGGIALIIYLERFSIIDLNLRQFIDVFKNGVGTSVLLCGIHHS